MHAAAKEFKQYMKRPKATESSIVNVCLFKGREPKPDPKTKRNVSPDPTNRASNSASPSSTRG